MLFIMVLSDMIACRLPYSNGSHFVAGRDVEDEDQ